MVKKNRKTSFPYLKQSLRKKKAKIAKTKRKKIGSKKKVGKEGGFEIGFEEVVIRCPSCGREFRIVKSSGFSTEGMLCQRCAAGGGMGLEDDDDF